MGVVSFLCRAQYCTPPHKQPNELFDQEPAKMTVLDRFAQSECVATIQFRAQVADLTSERVGRVSRESNFEKAEGDFGPESCWVATPRKSFGTKQVASGFWSQMAMRNIERVENFAKTGV